METKQMSEQEVAELKGRVEEFNKELIPLLQKYELGLGASAFINPNGTIGARPIMFDDRKKEAGAKSEKENPTSDSPKVLTEI